MRCFVSLVKEFKLNRKKVLVVDDSEVSLKALRQLSADTETQALAFFEARSGEAGLSLHETEGPFDYAFVDVHLPGISGFKMLERMREADTDAYARMQVFMMCSDGPGEEHSHDEAHGHDDACASLYTTWLVKPVDTALLRRYLLSDVRLRALVETGRDDPSEEAQLAAILRDAEHLSEKEIQALEYLVANVDSN